MFLVCAFWRRKKPFWRFYKWRKKATQLCEGKEKKVIFLSTAATSTLKVIPWQPTFWKRTFTEVKSFIKWKHFKRIFLWPFDRTGGDRWACLVVVTFAVASLHIKNIISTKNLPSLCTTVCHLPWRTYHQTPLFFYHLLSKVKKILR